MKMNFCCTMLGAFVGCLLALVPTTTHAQAWFPTPAPSTNWVCIASSANGSNVFAAARGEDHYHDPGPIFLSSDSGTSWTQSAAPIALWSSIASSADGTKLAATVAWSQDGRSTLYISTNSGISWFESSLADAFPSLNLLAVACSADGRIIIALSGVGSGEFYGSQALISTNFGSNWAGTDLSGVATSLACSADGTKIAGGFISPFGGWSMISTNLGASWYRGIGGQSVACSADGVRLIVSPDKGGPTPVWLSPDSGVGWSQVTNPPLMAVAVASSAEGTRLLTSGGPIFISADSGASWTQTGAPITNWGLVICSADGHKMFAAAQNSPSGTLIYTAQSTPIPALSISSSGTNARISWLIPSIDFTLQQTSSLEQPVWSDVGVPSHLNCTNLHYEVTIPTASDSMFYRLAAR